ncbi:hypothetical protein ACWNX6_00170 [Candidatus Vidania fulgoroideorum]
MIKVINITYDNLIKIKKKLSKNAFFFLKKKNIIFNNIFIKKNYVFISIKDSDLKQIKKYFVKKKKCVNISLIGEKIKSNIFDYLKLINFLVDCNVKINNLTFSEYKISINFTERKKTLKIINFIRKEYFK